MWSGEVVPRSPLMSSGDRMSAARTWSGDRMWSGGRMWSGEALLHGLNPHPARKLSPLPSKGTSNDGHHLSIDRREKSPQPYREPQTEIIGRRRLGRNGEVAGKPVESLRLRRADPPYPGN